MKAKIERLSAKGSELVGTVGRGEVRVLESFDDNLFGPSRVIVDCLGHDVRVIYQGVDVKSVPNGRLRKLFTRRDTREVGEWQTEVEQRLQPGMESGRVMNQTIKDFWVLEIKAENG